MTKVIGVNNRKNISPSIIGLIMKPSKSPKRIHNLFKGSKSSGFRKLQIKNPTDITKKKMARDVISIK